MVEDIHIFLYILGALAACYIILTKLSLCLDCTCEKFTTPV